MAALAAHDSASSNHRAAANPPAYFSVEFIVAVIVEFIVAVIVEFIVAVSMFT
jgi:hypothetical protein